MNATDTPTCTPVLPLQVLQARIDRPQLTARIDRVTQETLHGGLIAVTLDANTGDLHSRVSLLTDGHETTVFFEATRLRPGQKDPDPRFGDVPFITAVTLVTSGPHLAFIGERVAHLHTVVLIPQTSGQAQDVPMVHETLGTPLRAEDGAEFQVGRLN